jgi:hypothetical protein
LDSAHSSHWARRMFSPSVTAVRALFLTRSLRSWEEIRRSGRQFERSGVVKSGGALLRLAAAYRDGSSIGSGKDSGSVQRRSGLLRSLEAVTHPMASL